jgi:hypothetical protein
VRAKTFFMAEPKIAATSARIGEAFSNYIRRRILSSAKLEALAKFVLREISLGEWDQI